MLTGRMVGRAMLLGGLASVLFVACAKGNQVELASGAGGSGAGGPNPSTGGHHAGTGTGGQQEAGPTGVIGSPCDQQSDCTMGTCTDIAGTKYCTTACPPTCPAGSYCSIINGDPTCVPDLDQQCAKCNADTDCKLPTDVCLTAPPGDKFCARDCTIDGLCPNGFTCLDKLTYGGGDAGTDGGGAGDADAAGDSGDPDAGPPPAGMPNKWCVPNSGLSCPCNTKRDAVEHACNISNAAGVCKGNEVCNGPKAEWQGCTAGTPAAETCNAKDDNCDGKIDEGDPNALCAAMGAKPPNGSWGCKAGTCGLGACDPGWTAFPVGPASAGCTCPLEASEPNGSCATASDIGVLSDVGGPATVKGTLSSANDVDYWTFDTTDVNEGTTNSYHVNIAFTQPSPNDEFLIDVIRGGPCVEAPNGPSTGITSYDWCVNATDGATKGELDCGPTAATHCEDHSGRYWVRVYRKLGSVGTCRQYELTVTAHGDACDLTKSCP